jgi:hypothetical protein
MHSDKAAAVRDAINGCPSIVNEDDHIEYGGRDRFTTTRGGREITITGEHVKPARSKFRPAYIEQVGSVGNGDGAERPVHAVILEALWLSSSDVRSLSPQIVHEAAKHDVRIRFYPPDHRLDGDVWFVDPLPQIHDSSSDRCLECGSTYFQIKDGEPECARCGHQAPSEHAELTELTA